MKTLVSSIFILLVSFSVFFITHNTQDTNKSQNEIISLQEIKTEIVQEKSSSKSPTFIKEEQVSFNNQYQFTENPNLKLVDEIENYIGWININNTKIDYPVVKAKNNDFYLNHSYDLKENIAGAIFMDRRNLGNQFDQHTIIYGHHMKNGTMFTALNNYLEEAFFTENKSISFKDLYQEYDYQVISAYYVSADDYVLDYEINEATVNNFIRQSLYKTDYQYQEGDRILTLSTCNYILNNSRMIVHAVLSK